MKNNLIIFTIIIAVAGAGYAAYKITSPASNTETTTVSSSPLSLGKVQAGDTLTVNSVLLKTRGFVVVRKEENGQTGPIIGVSTILPEGENKNVLINLTERMREGENIYVTAHEDGDGNGIFQFPGPDVPATDNNGNIITMRLRTEPGIETAVSSTPSARTVEYSIDGFYPPTIEVSPGDSVTFVNNSDLNMWVISDPHPTHNGLVGFDQRGPVGTDGRFNFTFTKKGTWSYHNEINTTQKGAIIVK